jgi:glutamate racemase
MIDILPHSTIGVFDSGVGGLSVVQELISRLPDESILYIADQANVPYGDRNLIEVRDISEKIVRFLIRSGAKTIVVACNTASAAALYYLRETFPDTPFVGMEPAVKPAAEQTQSGTVGVLATPATFQGKLYESVVDRFASGVNLIQQTCPGLVEQIETGQINSDETYALLSAALKPLIEKNIDTLVLGCTHFPFVIPVIKKITGKDVTVIDPSPAIARQTERILEAHKLQSSFNEANQSPPRIILYTTGDVGSFERTSRSLLNVSYPVDKLIWKRGGLTNT